MSTITRASAFIVSVLSIAISCAVYLVLSDMRREVPAALAQTAPSVGCDCPRLARCMKADLSVIQHLLNGIDYAALFILILGLFIGYLAWSGRKSPECDPSRETKRASE